MQYTNHDKLRTQRIFKINFFRVNHYTKKKSRQQLPYANRLTDVTLSSTEEPPKGLCFIVEHNLGRTDYVSCGLVTGSESTLPEILEHQEAN